jgi:endoglucanase
MDRVETVVDQALARGFEVVLNVHHDSWIWADPTVSNVNLTMIEEKFSALWSQIGTRFRCKSSSLIFESLNEPVGTTQAHADELNKLQDLFLDAINKAGGYNPQRVVSLTGLGDDYVKTSEWFQRGTTYPNQPWALQFHYYSPYDFIFSAWGKTIWGSDADKATLDSDFSLLRGNFSGIPVFIGEWDASDANTETAARWKYFDYFIRTATKYSFAQMLWDNGADHYDRVNNKWIDPIDLSVLLSASKGVINSLADSTEDASATSQNSSAYLFHKVGDPVIAQSIPYLLNGNTLTNIKNAAGTVLTSSQYSISAGTVTFSATYLGSLYSSTAAPGVKDTLALSFSAGTPLTLEIVQYTTPTVATNTFKVDPSADLVIPVTWNGIGPAAVQALKTDGTYLADDWTVYLGPLQQARWTFGSWKYDVAAGTFTVTASGLTTIQAAGQTVTLTVEVSFSPWSCEGKVTNLVPGLSKDSGSQLVQSYVHAVRGIKGGYVYSMAMQTNRCRCNNSECRISLRLTKVWKYISNINQRLESSNFLIF